MTLVVVTALGGLGIVVQSRFRQRAVLRQTAGAIFKENGSSSTWSARNFWSLLAGEPTYIIYLPGDDFSAEDMFAYGKAFPESVVIRQRAMNDATMDHWVDRAVIPFSPSPRPNDPAGLSPGSESGPRVCAQSTKAGELSGDVPVPADLVTCISHDGDSFPASDVADRGPGAAFTAGASASCRRLVS